MDADRFDAVVRSLVAPSSRRTVLGLSSAGLTGLLLSRLETQAKKKRKKKKCKQCGPCLRPLSSEANVQRSPDKPGAVLQWAMLRIRGARILLLPERGRGALLQRREWHWRADLRRLSLRLAG